MRPGNERFIYSPEASDGTFDWPSKIGMAVWALILAAVVGLIAWKVL